MLRPLRTAISLAILLAGLWAAFAVELGDKTFAEHVDEISETPEAQQLVEDTRATINPALAEVRDRVLGEYVEAPTWIPDEDPTLAAGAATPEPEPRAASPVEQPAEPPLPGRRRAAPASKPAPEPDEGQEPALPGRR